jgi:deazaflavin-dependent oxidoreductase (nitroreductase family)
VSISARVRPVVERVRRSLIRSLGRLHATLYRGLRGAAVGRMGNVQFLLLTTRGRRSGKARTVPLLFLRDESAFVVVASNGGSREHPSWYLNLRASPDVGLQIRGTRINAVARTASEAERARYWPQLVEVYGAYVRYQEKAERTIPVVVLEPRPSG